MGKIGRPRKILTVRQVSEILKIDRQAVYQAIRRGRLVPARDVDTSTPAGAKPLLFFTHEEVERYTVNRTQQEYGLRRTAALAPDFEERAGIAVLFDDAGRRSHYRVHVLAANPNQYKVRWKDESPGHEAGSESWLDRDSVMLR